MAALLSLLLFASTLVAQVLGFHHVLIGNPLPQAPPRFHYPQNSSGAMIYTLTEHNVLAALNPRTGSSIWRQSFNEAHNFYIEGDDIMVNYGPSSEMLSMYSATTGYHKWTINHTQSDTTPLFAQVSSGSDFVYWPLEEDSNRWSPHDVVTLSNGDIVRRIDSNTGAVKWSISLNPDHVDPLSIPHAILPPSSPADDITIIVLDRKSESSRFTLSRIIISSVDGSRISGPSPLPSSSVKTPSDIALFPSRLVWLTPDGTLHTLYCHPSVSDKSLKALSPYHKGPMHMIYKINLEKKGYFVTISRAGVAEIYNFKDMNANDSSGGQLDRAWEFSDSARGSVFTGSLDKKDNIYVSRISFIPHLNLASLQIFSASKTSWSPGGTLTGGTFAYSEDENGRIMSVTVEVTPPTSPRLFSRFMIVSTSGSHQLWQDTTRNWVREEGLAHITPDSQLEESNIAFFEVPIETKVKNSKSYSQNAFISRVNRHLQAIDVKSIAQWIKRQVPSSDVLNQTGSKSPVSAAAATEQNWLKEQFGFQKWAIVASKLGKIYAVDLATGDIVWEKLVWQLPHLGASIKWNKIALLNKNSSDRSVIAVGEIEKKKAGHEILVYELDAMTGKLISSSKQRKQQIPGPSENIFTLPKGHEDTGLVVVGSKSQPYLYSIGKQPYNESLHSPLDVFFSVKHENSLSGYRLLKTDGETHVMKTWNLMFTPQEKVTHVIKGQNEPISSLGKVLGNRKALYKYLNPHLTLVITTSKEDHAVNVYVIDSVSGAIVYMLTNRGNVDVDGPITALLSANWLVYTYRDITLVGRPTILVSVELFENLDGERDPSKTFSSFEGSLPAAINSSFIYPFGINRIGITRTQLGVTTQNLVVATDRDQIVSVPRRWLDPRRPKTKPTKDDQAEMLIPYDALIPPDSRWIVSEEARVLGAKKIWGASTILESTSYVIVAGVDFYTAMVTPSKAFDTLSEDFNKTQLFLTLFGLAAALIIVRPMLRRKQLHAKWYS